MLESGAVDKNWNEAVSIGAIRLDMSAKKKEEKLTHKSKKPY